MLERAPQGHDRFITRKGAKLHYRVFGSGDGQPLVMCHGLMASGLQFEADAKWFANEGFFVIVPSLRGHGRSEANADPADYTARALAEDVLAMLDEEGIVQTDWVGNSLGGIAALELMGFAPERLNRVLMFGTSFKLDLPAIALLWLDFLYAFVPRRFMAWVFGVTTCTDKVAQNVVTEMVASADPFAVKATAADVRKYDLRENAKAFPRSLTVLKAKGDWGVNLVLHQTEAAMEGKPDFTLVKMDDAAHCANLDRPDDVRALIMQKFGA